MPSDFLTVAALDEILEDHIDQFASWLNGDTNYRRVANPTANDASNYVFDIQNVGSGGKAIRVKNSGGDTILAIDNTSVTLSSELRLIPATLSTVTPSQLGYYRNNLVNGWASGSMSGTVFTQAGAYNCTITRAATGVFNVAFGQTLPSNTYSIMAMGGHNQIYGVLSVGASKTTVGCQIAFWDQSSHLVDPSSFVSVIAVGG